MNRSRRMAALQAREMAARGWAVMQLDLAGCGDSEGDLGAVAWETWIEDALAAHRWLQTQTSLAPWLWGLRCGALLAVEAARRLPDPPHLLLWQPSLDGSTALRQFLRIADPQAAGQRLAALKAGTAQEVAGYQLSPELAAGLGASRLDPPVLQGASRRHLLWLDVSADGQALPGSLAQMPPWQGAGWDLQHQTLQGRSFWTSVEDELVPLLIDTTAELLGERSASAASPPPRPRPADEPRSSCIDGLLETPLALRCGSDALQAILSRPQAAAEAKLALVMVVGGPQVRTGAHRMFTRMARHFAAQGFPVLRFDLRGMGDSQGERAPFDSIDEEISAAIDALRVSLAPSTRIVLFGLCDGASAATLYVRRCPEAKVEGLVLLNPWARDALSLARTRLQHHYKDRLRDWRFWGRVLRGQVGWQAAANWWKTYRLAATAGPSSAGGTSGKAQAPKLSDLQAEVLRGWEGHSAIVLAEADETAREFDLLMREHPLRPYDPSPSGPSRVSRLLVADADHTLSRPGSLKRASDLISTWLEALTQTTQFAPANPPQPPALET